MADVAEHTPEQAQQLVAKSLAGLGRMAREVCCVLTRPELSSPAIAELGFIKVATSETFAPDFWEAGGPDRPETRAILIVQLGLRVDRTALDIAVALSRNQNVPSILMVVIADIEQICAAAGDNTEDLSSSLHSAQEAYIDGGADDVLLLDCKDRVSGHRVLEAINRIEILARRLSQEIDSIQQQAAKKVEEVKELASRKLQAAWKNQMWTLPGAVLESIPSEDPALTEWASSQPGGLGGVGGYNFEAKLGGGSFGTVFKAQHQEHGAVAVKVIQKSSMKNVSQLFSLNQELCLMQHVPPHPNVTAALTAFHTANCIYLVMEYAGGMSLHKFVRATLSSQGAASLPRDLARSFCVQQAVALSHLHGLMVVHRDLKPANFIVSDTGNVLRLVDFGFAVMLCSKEQRLTACCGSLPFCAPEVLRAGSSSRGYDPFAADIWSMALNFVELACGPYSIEKCLGWVPQHPTDPEQRKRDIDRLETLWAGTPDTGIEGLQRTVSQMLLLQPANRWSIAQVLGQEGLGVGLVATPPSRKPRPVKVRKDFGNGGNGAGRALDCEGNAGQALPLLDRMGGVGAVRSALERMFDSAIMSTSVGVLLGNTATLPSLRHLYLEEVTAFFDTVPGQTKEQVVLDRLGDAHRPWDFSDATFDILADQFAAALVEGGLRGDVVQDADARFRSLRAKVTAGYRAGCAYARQRNTSAWRSKLAAHEECDERAAAFAAAFARRLAKHRRLGPKMPSSLRDSECIKAHLLMYLGNDAKAAGPVPLQSSGYGLEDLVELVDTARQALVESCWSPDEVLLLQYAMFDEWDHVRLARAVADLASVTGSTPRVTWTSFVLRLQMAFVACPSNQSLCENAALPMCFARICEVLATRSCEDPWQLSFNSCNLTFSDAHFDSLIELIPGASMDLQPGAAEKVAAAVQAMRSWVVSGGANTARAG